MGRVAGVWRAHGFKTIGGAEGDDFVLELVGVARRAVTGVAHPDIDAEAVRGLVGEFGAAIEDGVRALPGLPAEHRVGRAGAQDVLPALDDHVGEGEEGPGSSRWPAVRRVVGAAVGGKDHRAAGVDAPGQVGPGDREAVPVR